MTSVTPDYGPCDVCQHPVYGGDDCLECDEHGVARHMDCCPAWVQQQRQLEGEDW
jgi:hypothetical protein